MKKLIVTLLALLFLINTGFSQEKIERFCIIHTYSNGNYSKLINIRIDYGQNTASLYRDSSVKTGLQNITSMKTETEVLNQMSAMGWNLFSVIPNDHLVSTYVFRKYFTKDDLVNSSPK